jgi:amidophosphoribosyltransferase
MPVKSELVAHGKTVAQVEAEIGADKLIYQDLTDLVRAVVPSDEEVDEHYFDCSVFNGKYITGDIDDAYLARIEQLRNDKAKVHSENTIELNDVSEHM